MFLLIVLFLDQAIIPPFLPAGTNNLGAILIHD